MDDDACGGGLRGDFERGVLHGAAVLDPSHAFQRAIASDRSAIDASKR
jgi:hypothetical protein